MLLRMEFLRIVCALSILVILFAKPFESVVVARRTKPATKAIADGGSSRNSMWKSLINRVKKLIVKPKTLKIRTALTTPAGNRLLKEKSAMLANPPLGCSLERSDDLRKWTVRITGARGTVYDGEQYRLKLEFPVGYPSQPPRAYFLKPVPRHTHIYSNGDICLNILGADWSPAITAEGVVISILSMLSSAKEKSIPLDNALHSSDTPGQQQDGWLYHDERC